MSERKSACTLCLALASCRLGFIVFAQNHHVVDFGVKDVPATESELILAGVRQQIERYAPSLVLIQDRADPHCHLGDTARNALAGLEQEFSRRDIFFQAVSKADVWNSLGLPQRSVKQDVAEHVARLFLPLADRLPLSRRLWEKEAKRMAVFTATGLYVGAAYRETIDLTPNHPLENGTILP